MASEKRRCRSCRLEYAVNRDGLIRMHGDYYDESTRLSDGCPGSRRPPLGEPDPNGPPDDATYRDAANVLLSPLELALEAGWIAGPDGMVADLIRGVELIRRLNNSRRESAVAHDD